MGYLNKNLAVLDATNDRAKEKILNATLPEERRAVLADSGSCYFQYKDSNVWKGLTSAHNPIRDAQRQLASISDWDVSLFFVLGEAGLFHLEEVLRKVSKRTCVMLVSRNPSYLRLVLESRDLADSLSDPRLLLIVDESESNVRLVLRQLIGRESARVPTFTVFAHPIEQKIQRQPILDFFDFIKRIFETMLVNFNTATRYESYWARNFVCNSPFLVTGQLANDKGNTWTGKPVIVVGAGPSLNKNIELLKRAKNHALIICVDTAYRILERHNIEPDLIATIDGTPLNAKHLEGCKYHEIPLLVDAYAHYSIVTNHTGYKLFTDAVGLHADWWALIHEPRPDSVVSSGGSVATIATSFARYIGADPIVLIGTDLSYPDGKYYANGALKENETIEDIRKKRQLHQLTDIYGNTVYSTFDYIYYLNWFEQEAGVGGRTFINATEGGVLKRGFLIKTLSDTLNEYCQPEVPVAEWIAGLRPVEMTPTERQSFVRNVIHSKNELRLFVRISSILIKLLETYVAKLDAGEIDGLLPLVKNIQRGQSKLSKLRFALAFLNGHSTAAVWKDAVIADAIDEDRNQYNQREIATINAKRTWDLLLNFNRLAQESLEMHQHGVSIIRRVWDLS